MASRRIIVLGSSHYNTVGMVQCLGKEGLYVIGVICGGAGILNHSIYISEIHIVDNYQEGVLFISQNLVDSEPTMIIPCGDEAALVLEMFSDLLKDSFIFQRTSEDIGLEKAMNKLYQASLAVTSGFSIPITFSLDRESRVGIIDNNVFPCIIKPLHSYEGDKNNICIARNREEYCQLISKMLDLSPRLLVQEYIEHKDSELNILGCGLTNGDCIIPYCIRKIRTFPNGKGSVSVALVEPIIEEILPIVSCIKQIVKELGYIGLFSVELIYVEKSKKYYFIEMNLRNDALNPFIVKAGCNLPYIHYLDMNGEVLPSYVPITRNLKMICEPIHLASLYHHDISLWNWLKDIRGCDHYLLYEKSDRRVFYAQFWQKAQSFVKSRISNKHNG